MPEEAEKPNRRWLVPVLAAGVLVVAAAVAGWAWYRDQIAPYGVTALTVGDQSLTMGYLVKRMRLSGLPPLVQLEALADEQVAIQAAARPPYGFEVTVDDIDARLRLVAAGVGPGLTEDAFSAWYREQLHESRLTDAEFRGVVRNRLLAEHVRERLAEPIRTVTPQARILLASAPTEEAAQAFGRTLMRGDDFTDALADPAVAAAGVTGGEIGWMPCDALSPAMCEAAFSLLPGWPSEPIPLLEGGWAVMVVAERDELRAIDPQMVAALAETAFNDWLAKERAANPPRFGDPRRGWTSGMEVWARAEAGPTRRESP